MSRTATDGLGLDMAGLPRKLRQATGATNPLGVEGLVQAEAPAPFPAQLSPPGSWWRSAERLCPGREISGSSSRNPGPSLSGPASELFTWISRTAPPPPHRLFPCNLLD